MKFASIENLIQSIQLGNPLRIGRLPDSNGNNKPQLEYWIDANFITILNGHEFNQIDPINMQISKLDPLQVTIVNSPQMRTTIIGTNGKLLSRFNIPDLEKIEMKKFAKH